MAVQKQGEEVVCGRLVDVEFRFGVGVVWRLGSVRPVLHGDALRTKSLVGGGIASTLPLRISLYHFFSAEHPMTTPARPIPPSAFDVMSLLSHCSLQFLSATH